MFEARNSSCFQAGMPPVLGSRDCHQLLCGSRGGPATSRCLHAIGRFRIGTHEVHRPVQGLGPDVTWSSSAVSLAEPCLWSSGVVYTTDSMKECGMFVMLGHFMRTREAVLWRCNQALPRQSCTALVPGPHF